MACETPSSSDQAQPATLSQALRREAARPVPRPADHDDLKRVLESLEGQTLPLLPGWTPREEELSDDPAERALQQAAVYRDVAENHGAPARIRLAALERFCACLELASATRESGAEDCRDHRIYALMDQHFQAFEAACAPVTVPVVPVSTVSEPQPAQTTRIMRPVARARQPRSRRRRPLRARQRSSGDDDPGGGEAEGDQPPVGPVAREFYAAHDGLTPDQLAAAFLELPVEEQDRLDAELLAGIERQRIARGEIAPAWLERAAA